MEAFDDSVGDVWSATAGGFALAAVRDRPVLESLYDGVGSRFIRIGIREDGELCGWAVLLATPFHGHKHFGNLKLGSIVDLLAAPGYEARLIRAAVERLQREGVDLIVTNQSLGSLLRGLNGAGFLEGPSNFLFAASPKLVELVGPLQARLPTIHLTRGDGDGPINL